MNTIHSVNKVKIGNIRGENTSEKVIKKNGPYTFTLNNYEVRGKKEW